ncbi:MAG: NUDIX hydrolase [Clostridia bacterium]|nr:NUDIX hydrolase [Clostridia bacterium]
MSDERRDARGLTEAEFLAAYDENRYRHPSVTTDMAIFTRVDGELKLLMIKRANHPFIGGYALPGGFLEMDESLEACAARELFEETGVADVRFYQVGAYGDVDRDPRTRIVSVLYTAMVERCSPRAGDDAAAAQLFSVFISAAGEDESGCPLYELTLCGERRLHSVLKREAGACVRTRVVTSDVASDHAAMVFDAYSLLAANGIIPS